MDKSSESKFGAKEEEIIDVSDSRAARLVGNEGSFEAGAEGI